MDRLARLSVSFGCVYSKLCGVARLDSMRWRCLGLVHHFTPRAALDEGSSDALIVRKQSPTPIGKGNEVDAVRTVIPLERRKSRRKHIKGRFVSVPDNSVSSLVLRNHWGCEPGVCYFNNLVGFHLVSADKQNRFDIGWLSFLMPTWELFCLGRSFIRLQSTTVPRDVHFQTGVCLQGMSGAEMYFVAGKFYYREILLYCACAHTTASFPSDSWAKNQYCMFQSGCCDLIGKYTLQNV